MPSLPYVHGYSPRESERLTDQAQTLSDLLHHDEIHPPGSLILEAGCGTGAQTVILARNNPAARLVSVDRSPESLAQARRATEAAGLANVRFETADIMRLPYPDAMFDVVFVCFVLEHLADPPAALVELKRVLRPGGTITVIEGDHGSAYFHPDSGPARKAIQCLVDLQKEGGGDALIGRRLYPLLTAAGFDDVRVSPRAVYADASRPAMVEGFTHNTFTAMVAGVETEVLRRGLMAPVEWRKAMADLFRTAGMAGVFNYTFFKARAIRTS
jgi:SAM-dependent methyltransferase